jgi:hypothetical protein
VIAVENNKHDAQAMYNYVNKKVVDQEEEGACQNDRSNRVVALAEEIDLIIHHLEQYFVYRWRSLFTAVETIHEKDPVVTGFSSSHICR